MIFFNSLKLVFIPLQQPNQTAVLQDFESIVESHSSLFCDATGTIVALPKRIGEKPTVLIYAVVIKHPVDGKAPIVVAELITEDHTVLSTSFLQSFRRAETLLYGASNLINSAQSYH